MAKRGRRAAEKSFADLEPAVQRQVFDAIDSAADEPAASIYRRFGLEQRGIRKRTFSKLVKDRRETASNRATGLAVEPKAPTWEELEEQSRVGLKERLDAGDAKAYEIVGIVHAAFKRKEVRIKEAAELRAAELHEQKMTALCKAVQDAAKDRPDRKLDAGEVADLIDRVMRGEEI